MPFLCSIAEIRTGATLRGRDATRPDPNGSYLFLRIGDISHDGVLLNDELLRIEPNEPINPRACLCTGDVLFSNRGARTTAFVFHALETRTIVGPQFFIIRADKNGFAIRRDHMIIVEIFNRCRVDPVRPILPVR